MPEIPNECDLQLWLYGQISLIRPYPAADQGNVMLQCITTNGLEWHEFWMPDPSDGSTFLANGESVKTPAAFNRPPTLDDITKAANDALDLAIQRRREREAPSP